MRKIQSNYKIIAQGQICEYSSVSQETLEGSRAEIDTPLTDFNFRS